MLQGGNISSIESSSSNSTREHSRTRAGSVFSSRADSKDVLHAQSACMFFEPETLGCMHPDGHSQLNITVSKHKVPKLIALSTKLLNAVGIQIPPKQHEILMCLLMAYWPHPSRKQGMCD